MFARLVAWLLGSAVRRWPAGLRDEVAREWAAEVHALGREAGVATPVRGWRQLRFAVSLALSRPSGAEAAGPRGWPRQVSPAGGHAAWLLLAPLATLLLVPVVVIPIAQPLTGIGYPASVAVFAVMRYVALAALAVSIGTWLARRLLRRRAGLPAAAAACGWSTLPVIGGLLVTDGLARGSDQVRVGVGCVAAAAVCLAVLLPPTAAGLAALSGRGRRFWAALLAGLATPVLTLATVFALVQVSGPAPADVAGQPWWWLPHLADGGPATWYIQLDDQPPILTVLQVLPRVVFATVVVALAHAIRLARPLPARIQATPAPAPAPARP